MAMRRVWVLASTVTTFSGGVIFSVCDGKPEVFRALEEAQAEADDINDCMQSAVDRGELTDYDEVQPLDAWLVDETGIISLKVHTTHHGVIDIPDLQLYCESNGMV